MIRLHHCPQTRSMRALWLLGEIGCEFEVVTHAFGRNLRQAEFLALNPAGRVPALELDGKTIWESGAITEVLCERFPEAGLGRAVDHPERTDWLIWVHFAETVSQHTAALTQQHVALYEDAMRSPVIMKLEAARLGKCYAALDARLAGRAWLLDGGFSAADVSVGQAVYMGRHFARTEPFPALHAWMERCGERAAYRASLPKSDEAPLYTQHFYPAWDA
ncbi:glutathione S-transferase family protein [Tropicimonas marinistellae]|uniref:glutathione S-transferase family protein n=1 Tax=Tropicimonas marinistellae TaxID=1739787 RepID=UPI000829C16E|nr:glutathione S-transferase family protein [Tropicimonas marinistellae]